MRLRYLGSTPVTFVAAGLEVTPGDEFDVADESAAGFTARIDIEAVSPPGAPRRKPAKPDAPEPDAAPTGAAAPVTPKEV